MSEHSSGRSTPASGAAPEAASRAEAGIDSEATPGRRADTASAPSTAPATAAATAAATGRADGGAASKRTLRAEDLHKAYKKRRILNGVSLHVDSGEVVGLLGPNGAGKTTCFYMVVGLVKPDGGRILLDGTDITTHPMHARARLGVGYLPQEVSVFRQLSVEQNVMAILETRRSMTTAMRRDRLEELLEELQIGHLRESLGISLSGGEKRRVEIARALAADPGFILLDEPFAGVDPISVLDIQKIILHLKLRGIGVLITDHGVREMLGICDRAYILSEGGLIAEGTPAEVMADEEVRKVYLGENFRI